jgi:LPS O-antigen subunit length determinant protein (WzzB/FepE family)
VTELRYPRQTNEEEINLVELFQKIWGQKWLIAVVTSVVLILAVAYILISKPVYSVSIVLAPAPVNTFGSIAGDIGVGQQMQVAKSVISFGTDLANDTLALVVKNVESASVLEGFNHSLKRSGDYTVQVTKDNFPIDPVSVSVVSDSAAGAKEYLDGYMAHVSKISAVQLNEYFQALRVSHTISPESLYSVERFSELPTHPIKPKKFQIVVLGFVLGGMLGVFSALIRLAILKRSAEMN